jgi:helix-turn-helix protein
MKTMNKNMDNETFEELKQIYDRLKELGLKKLVAHTKQWTI